MFGCLPACLTNIAGHTNEPTICPSPPHEVALFFGIPNSFGICMWRLNHENDNKPKCAPKRVWRRGRLLFRGGVGLIVSRIQFGKRCHQMLRNLCGLL